MMNLSDLFSLGMDREIPELSECLHGLAINVGDGNKHISGAVSVDYPDWDADSDPLPFSDGSVGTVWAFHFLEHCREPVMVLQEFQRVLSPGGVANIVVPYYTSQMQAHDLDHKNSFCEETWRTLFSTPYYNKNDIRWEFDIGTNVIMGVAERNLALVTQLRRK